MFDQVKDKDSFSSVGTLISWIQRDLLGTDVLSTAGIDNSGLYEIIRELYGELLIELDNGNYDKAEEIGIEAYLENFEYLEPEIEIADAELLYQLEWDMREELRAMIKNKESPETIRAFLVDSIIPRLDIAEAKVADLKAQGVIIQDALANKPVKPMGSATEGQKGEVRAEIDFIRQELMATQIYYEQGDTNLHMLVQEPPILTATNTLKFLYVQLHLILPSKLNLNLQHLEI